MEKKWLSLDEMYAMFGNVASLKEIFYDWMGLNNWLFVQINSLHTGWYDSLMLFITHLGSSRNFPYYLFALALIVSCSALARQINRKGGTKYYISGWIGVFCVLILGFALNIGVIKLIKNEAGFPRPYIALATETLYMDYHPVVLDRDPNPEDDYRSFPSGHVAFFTLLVVSMWPMLSHRLQWAGVIAIFLMAWSRVAVGMHFPADAVGAIIVTSTLIITLRAILYTILRKLFRLNS